jgi:hypothetical protein
LGVRGEVRGEKETSIMLDTLVFSRAWAMPDKWTFRIAPIEKLLQKYVPSPNEWVDPFAGWTSPARHRNDLNTDAPVEHHEDAELFLKRFDRIEGILFDPPYSPRQISECYKGIGLKVGMKETQSASLYARVKNAAASKIISGGIAISFGWNSCGFGEKRGFELVEILMVCHGGAHNDTIVTVERRKADLFL